MDEVIHFTIPDIKLGVTRKLEMETLARELRKHGFKVGGMRAVQSWMSVREMEDKFKKILEEAGVARLVVWHEDRNRCVNVRAYRKVK